MTRPEFIDFEKNKFHSYLELKQMRHPGVESTGVKFIPNDTIVGKRYDIGGDVEQKPSTLLISGPNMGGKSTLLRQT
jgi:DNA mismatch repair protein MSH6